MSVFSSALGQKKVAPYIFLSPFLILFLAFSIYPIGYSIFISFFDWRLTGMREFVGLENYTRLFDIDPFFFHSLWVTGVLLVFGSLLQHFIAIPLAMLLNDKSVAGREFFKTAFFIPYITSAVVVSLVFFNIFQRTYGWADNLFVMLGLDPVEWLNDPPAMRAVVAIMLNWRFVGWNMVIYLAGLQAIPKDLYENAHIDGATKVQQHLNITLPLLLPVIFFATSISLIFGMQLFDEPYVLFGGYQGMGGHDNAALTTTLYLLQQAFRVHRFGRASAIAWVLFLIIMGLTAGNRVITRKLDHR